MTYFLVSQELLISFFINLTFSSSMEPSRCRDGLGRLDSGACTGGAGGGGRGAGGRASAAACLLALLRNPPKLALIFGAAQVILLSLSPNLFKNIYSSYNMK